jgi:hypothetical protein
MSGKMKAEIERIKDVMMASNIRRPDADLTTLEEYLAKMKLDPELCTFIDSQNDYFEDTRPNKDVPMKDYLKNEILKTILGLHIVCDDTKKDFTGQILHKEEDPEMEFDTVNIMTLFVVGLLQVGSGTFTYWINMTENDDDFCKYVRDFLLQIAKPSQVHVFNSTKDDSEKPDRPNDDSKIPSTLCITDSKNVISISRVKKIFVLDVLDEVIPWNIRLKQGDTITSFVPLWYVYVLWMFRDDDEKTGCYGVKHEQNCYFFAYNLTGTGVSDLDVEEIIREFIDVPYQAYTSCIQKFKFIPEEIVSKLDSNTFKYNMLLYVHLFVLGYFHNEKIIFYACHEYDRIIQDALLSGKAYEDFYNKLKVAGEGLMIESTPDDDVIEALAIAHLDLMEDKDYYFSSDVPRSVTRMSKDRFITTCPVDYQWVFENERLKDCDKWKTKMTTLIQKVSTGRGSFKDVGIIRRIIDCIPEKEKESYDEDTSELFKIFNKSVDIGMKINWMETDTIIKLGYIVFDFGKYGEKNNLFHTGSGIDQFCHNEQYKEAMKEYFQYPSIHPHFNDFKHKYVLWNKENGTFSVRDSSELHNIKWEDLTFFGLNQFPFCPFCKEKNIVSSLSMHIKNVHKEEFKKFQLANPSSQEQKKLDASGAKTPIKFGEGGDAEGTSGTDGAVDAPKNINTPGSAKTPDTAISFVSNISDNDRKFEDEHERKNQERIERLNRLRAAQDPTQPTTDSEPGSPRAAGGSNQKGKLKPIERSQSEASMNVKKKPKNNRPLSAAETRTGVVVDQRFADLEPSANPPPPDGGAAAETDEVADPGRASPTGSTADSQKTTDAGVTSSVVGSNDGTPRPAWPDDVPEDVPEPVTPTPTPDPTGVEDGTSRKSRPSTAKRTQATRTTFVETEESPRDGGEGEIPDLEVSNRTTQGNDHQTIKELKLMRRAHEVMIRMHKLEIDELRQTRNELQNEKSQLQLRIKELEERNEELHQSIQTLTDEIVKQNTEHTSKIQKLKGEKDTEIAELQKQSTTTTTEQVKALGTVRDTLQKENAAIKKQIHDNTALLESIRKEIKDNERKKDQNVKQIEEEIDALYGMDIENSDMEALLKQDDKGNHNPDKYVLFKKEVLEEQPMQEKHSLCALFLMYESMAGTWKAFVEQRALNKIDNVVIQKLMHELRLYSSIGNHNATVKGLVSKHFKEFVEEFKLEAGAGATVAEQVQSVQAVAGPAPASVEPEADASEEPAASDSEEPEVDASEKPAAPASEEPEVNASARPEAPDSEADNASMVFI